MPKQIIASAALLLMTAGGLSPALALTREELVARIQAAGYAQIFGLIAAVRVTIWSLRTISKRDASERVEKMGRVIVW